VKHFPVVPADQNANQRSRRSFLQLSGAAAIAAMGMPILTEQHLASMDPHPFPKGAVVIDKNENPLGPCSAARDAINAIAPQGGRYADWLTNDLTETFSSIQGLKPEYVKPYAGSSGPLHYSVLAFTSPTKCYVGADPGYEAGTHAAGYAGARVVNVPLTKTYSHDVKAMLAAAPDAGLFYVCTPNNPTGSMTSHSDIEFLVANKPKGSVVMVDEAYIHFSNGTSAIDLVKADKDVVVLRTFSKLYGMAGLRCGFAIARPDLIEKIDGFSGFSPLPVTGVVAANVSLKDSQIVAERKEINTKIRQSTFEWLDTNGYSYVPSESNCFMLDGKRPAKELITAMAAQNVYIGRPWPIWPTHVRITVGTQTEMEAFQAALKRVSSGATTAIALPPKSRLNLDGAIVPSLRA
jgi:histidinol-phosphate aminotransferase